MLRTAVVLITLVLAGSVMGCGKPPSNAINSVDDIFRDILFGRRSADEAIRLGEDGGLAISAAIRQRAERAERVHEAVTNSENQEAACETVDWVKTLQGQPSAPTILMHARTKFSRYEEAREFSEDLASLLAGDPSSLDSVVCAAASP